MRESNTYHKFIGYGQKKSGNIFETLKFPIWFDYYTQGSTNESANMFKGLHFDAGSATLITHNIRGLVVNDRIFIDESPSLITKINTIEKQKLAGQRWLQRKKIYIIELEG